jgi:DNA-binding GntR family transcriptional regulator
MTSVKGHLETGTWPKPGNRRGGRKPKAAYRILDANKLVDLMSTNPHISERELARQLGVSRPRASQWIIILKETGIVSHADGSGWVINREPWVGRQRRSRSARC